MVFLILFLVPVLIMAIGAMITKKIDWQEYLIMTGTQAFVALLSCLAVSCENTYDTQILNGEVTGKEQNTVSCSHSYDCNCRQETYDCGTSKNPQTCSRQVCDICYEHSHDYDWDVYSNIGTFTIDRIDRQGVRMPERWKIVRMGEPVSKVSSYENYVKGSPDTLFRNSGSLEKYKNAIPEMPMEVYDYYRLNRLVQVGVSVQDADTFNERLSQINKKLGPAHQANVIVVLTTKPQEYFYALRQAWIGGKKNDVIAVVGVENTSEHKPVWAEIMAWDLDKKFDVELRDRILALKEVNHETMIPILKEEVTQHFKRKPMKDFEYLSSVVQPTEGQWWFTLIVGFLVAIAQVFIYSQPGVEGPWMHRTYNSYRNRRYNSWNRY